MKGKSKLAIRNRIIAFVLSIAMVMTIGDFNGLQFVKAEGNYSFSLSYNSMKALVYDEELEEYVVSDEFEAYANNTDTVLSNSSGYSSLDIYVDSFTRVDFDFTTTSTHYRIYYFNGEYDGQAPIEIKDGKCVGDVDSLVSDYGILTYDLDNKILSLDSHFGHCGDSTLRIVDLNSGSYDTTINIHTLDKYYEGDADSLSITTVNSTGEELRQGKYMYVDFPTDNTDGFEWTVANSDGSGNVTSDVDDNIKATISERNSTASTKHEREKSVKLSAKSDRGTGWVKVTAKTTSGIENENTGGKLIALTNRGFELSREIFITEWIKATEVYFENYDDGTTGQGDDSVTYNFLAGESVKLSQLLKALSDKVDSGTGELRTANDDIVYKSSDGSVGSVSGDVIKFKKKGQITVTAQAEDDMVSDTCNIYVRQISSAITIYINGKSTETISLRPGNSVKVVVKEDSGADEELVWNKDVFGDYLDCELITDNGDSKTYKFTVKPYESTESRDINLTVRTNRSSTSETSTAKNESDNLKITLNPAVENGSTIKTPVTFEGEEAVDTDEINLYNGEKITINGSFYNTENVKYSPTDQFIWDAYYNPAYISKADYPDNDFAATVISSMAIIGDSKLKVTALSNENVTKEIIIHNKQKIQNATLTLEGESEPKISVGDTYQLYTAISPENADETLYYETPDNDTYIELNSETGELTAKKKTEGTPVTVNVYAYHSHGTNFDDGFSKKRLVGSINITILDVGDMSLSPSHKTLAYNDANYDIIPSIKASGEGETIDINSVVINWVIENDGDTFLQNVAELSVATGSTNVVKSKKVGKAKITATFGQGENQKSADSTVTVTAPIKDDKITVTGINTNTSTTVDENSYIYLPNGVSLGLTPVLTSDG
nr:hypothetical protein [Lachnospiraceae bacterium]